MYIDSVSILDGFKNLINDFASRYTKIKSTNESLINSAEDSAMQEIRDAENEKQILNNSHNANIQQEENEKKLVENDLVRKVASERQNLNSMLEAVNKETESKKKSINEELLYLQNIEDIFVALFACQRGVYTKSRHYNADMYLPDELSKYYSETSAYIQRLTLFYWYKDLQFVFGVDEAPTFIQDARERLGVLNEENTSAEDFVQMLCNEVCSANQLNGKIWKSSERRKHKENVIYIFIQFRCYMRKLAQSLGKDLQAIVSESEEKCSRIREDYNKNVAELQLTAARLIETHENTIACLKAEYHGEIERLDKKIKKQYADLKDEIQRLNANLKKERDDFCKDIEKELEEYFGNCMTGATIGLNTTPVTIRDYVRLNSCYEGFNRSLVYKTPTEYKTYVCIGNITFEYEELTSLRSCRQILSAVKDFLERYFEGDQFVVGKGLTLPYVINFTWFSGLCFEYSSEEEFENAKMACRSTLFHMLTDTKPLSVYFTMIDSKLPSGFFSAFNSFLGSGSGNIESVINKCRIYNTEDDIKDVLDTLGTGVSESGKKFEYKSIIEFNRGMLARKKPLHIVFITDIKNGSLLDSSLESLNVVFHGMRDGYSCIFMRDKNKASKMSMDLNFSGRVLEYIGKENIYLYRVKGTDYTIKFYSMPDAAIVNKVGAEVSECIRTATYDTIHYSDVCRSLSKIKNVYKTIIVENCLFDENNTPRHFELNSNLLHTVIFGDPQFGKTRFIHSLIASIVGKYSPEVVKIHVVDLKPSLMDTQIYSRAKIPHLGIVSNVTSRAFGLNLLMYFKRRMDEIGAEINSVGKDLKANSPFLHNRDDYMQYRNDHPELELKSIPREILFIDEIQELIGIDDDLSKKCIGIIRQILCMGAAFGLHLVISTQWLNNLEKSLGIETILSEIQYKILFFSKTGYSKLGIDDARLKSLTRGQAYFESSIVDVALIDGTEEEDFLNRVANQYPSIGCKTLLVRDKISDGISSPFSRFYNGDKSVDLSDFPIILGESLDLDKAFSFPTNLDSLIRFAMISGNNSVVESVCTTIMVCLLSRIIFNSNQLKTRIVFADYTNSCDLISDTICSTLSKGERGICDLLTYYDSFSASEGIKSEIKQLRSGELNEIYLFVNGLGEAIKDPIFIQPMSFLATYNIKAHVFLFAGSKMDFETLKGNTSIDISGFIRAIYDGTDEDYRYTVGKMESYWCGNVVICRYGTSNYQISPFNYDHVQQWITNYIEKLKGGNKGGR